MEPNSPKKIQFSVPLFQSQLDPQAAEHLLIDGPGSEAECQAVKVFDVGSVAENIITVKCRTGFMMLSDCPISGGLSCADLLPGIDRIDVETQRVMSGKTFGMDILHACTICYCRLALESTLIRKRRPTPATLVIYNEPSVSGDDRQTSGSQIEHVSTVWRCAVCPVLSAELQLVVEQHFQRQEQQEAGLSDSPDTPSPITAQHANAAQWANQSSSEPNGNESNVSSEGQQGSSGAGGREHSDNQQEERESNHPPRLSQKQLDTLSEEPGDMLPRRKDTPYQHQPPFIPGVKLLKNQTDSSSSFQEDEETCDELKDSLRE
ncbi:hypothetical protein E1301_Tti010122 [Triplophysa tibetana]|uniref:Uncharacterized protein n=1 Tax=Triplophysa tibetana TaxID=1572043 RepID=A0A5A9P0W1_9TELE|nr:hypothetical protein E1301_Tti010122 [Triplophysa tibetana]